MDSCNIKVAIKVRPFNYKERLDGKVYWKIESNSVVHIDPITEKKNGEQFFFDRVFCGQSTNYDVFDEIVRPIIDRGVQGFNGTVFAYGQTASGKTYTMSGDQSNPGIIPLAINYMFSAMNSSTSREYLLRACYLEIYNEKVIDLLDQNDSENKRKKIQIQKDGLHITPLKAVVCQNAQMVIDLMKIGEKNRIIGETNMNERSSRSHTIFRIILESRNIDDDCDGAYQQSVINLVDLAGSERSSQQQSSIERFKEGCKINSSLTTLGLVIQQLSECPDSSQHINFRDSKLTRILQTSLGGNSLTAIICTVTLAVDEQTNNTMSFASRAKKIKNTAKVNENVTDETLLKRYRVQLSKLNKELEGIKQNQFGKDEVNEIKYKYQEEKRTNEELKERIMRLQKNMITSSEGHKDQASNKKGYNRRRTWGGKLDTTYSSNSLLETIEEDVNMHRPSVPSNFGHLNKEFKTPLEPFEWDLIRAEDHTLNTENINNVENDFSPPSNMPPIVCETPKKVLRERVNNYKNMFELSMKENNELREFTTLEKQMFHEHNEQLKDLSNLKNQVDDLQREKNESAKMIEILKHSIELVKNEKRDVEVIMEIQKQKYEKRETELLTTIKETRHELNIKEELLKNYLSNDTFIIEKQEEIKKFEIKVKEMNEINNIYINEIEMLKSQLLNKDEQLNIELSKHCLLLNELTNLQNHVVEVKTIPWVIKFLNDEGYFTLRNSEIEELDQLLKHIHNTLEKLQQENQNLRDENNNLKLTTNNFTNHINNIEIENDKLKSELNLIESNIKSIINEFSASSEIDVDNSDTNYLIEFAATYFEQNTNKNKQLSNENILIKKELSVSNSKLSEIKSFVFDNIDIILQYISSMEIKSNTDIEKFKIELSNAIEENIFLKSNIKTLDKLIFDCVEIVKQVKTNQSNFINLQDELVMCNTIKSDFQLQIQQLNVLNANLESVVENQTIVEKTIKEELNLKSVELNDAFIKLHEIQLAINDYELKNESNEVLINQLNIELETVNLNFVEKSNLVIELNERNLELLNKYNELETCYQSNVYNIEQNKTNESKLQDELVLKTNNLQYSIEELKEMKTKVEIFESEIINLNSLLDCEKTQKSNLIIEINNLKSELTKDSNNIVEINRLNNLNSELIIKLEEKDISINKTNEELLAKTNELDNICTQVTTLLLSIEDMNKKIDYNATNTEKLINEIDNIKYTNSKLIKDFENEKLKETEYNLKKIDELNKVINHLKFELDEKSSKEKVLKNEFQFVNAELENAISLIYEVKSVMNILNVKCESNNLLVDQLNNELKHIKFTLNEKINLIVELENTNLKLLTRYENSDVTDKLNKIIINLTMELDEKTKTVNELQAKDIHLKNSFIAENETQTLIENTKNELNSSNTSIEQYNSELTSKSNLSTELENMDSELLLKFSKSNKTGIKDDYSNIQDQLKTVINEKTLIQMDFDFVNQNLLKISKHHDETKVQLENIIQQQILNYQKLYREFIALSCDIESILKHQIDTESNLREEILCKTTELNDLQKQLYDSSLQQDYDKLEEEYMVKTRECSETQETIKQLKSILLNKEESEKNLIDNIKSKSIALEEYKKNVEFLFMRNDSFQIRVNDFEENVLVDLNEEFDSMKSELVKKTEYEKTLLEEKLKIEDNLNELQEKFINITKELEHSDKRSEDLILTINVLEIEIKNANSVKENLEHCLNEAEHELLKAGYTIENLEHELHVMQRELKSTCNKAECVERELLDIESKINGNLNKNNLEGCNIRNQLFDSLIDYVHDIKLKFTELNSALISGNQKLFRTKVMSVEDEILHENSDIHFKSLDNEINNLHKVLEDKIDLVAYSSQKTELDSEININELQNKIKNLSDENYKLLNDITLVENNLKEKILLVENLSNELNQVKIQYKKLEEHNQATNEQIHYSFDIDSELRNGKKNLVNEINLLEPGKTTGILNQHNLSNLLDIFVNLIMTKEQQIITDLVNDHNKIKQHYVDQIKQYEEDIKKGKEWQEQVENDNEKLSLELENLKSQKDNFPNREIEIKDLTEKVLEAENQSFDYLSELQELKTQISKTSEQNYLALSNEFETFKTSSEQSIQDLKEKLEDLTKKYNESLSMYKDQRYNRTNLESQIEKIQSECFCLKAIIDKKDEDIKNLFEKVQLKTKEYEILIEKNSLQKDEMKDIYEKKIDELLLELNEKTQKIYCTEKLLKEVTKNYNQLIEEKSTNLLKIQYNTHENYNSNICKLENLEKELKVKIEQLEDADTQSLKYIHEIEDYKLKIIACENQIENCYQTLKLKDDQINDYKLKLKMNNDDLIKVNCMTEKLGEILNCTGTLSTIYENASSLISMCKDLKDEIEELKYTNKNLDNECESMLIEIKNKDENIIEYLTKEDELKQKIELLMEERDFLKNKSEQFNTVNNDVKKLNDELCSYEQNIYQLRKEKGQLIVQHDKEIKQLKSELKEVQSKNLELLNEYNKLSETAWNLEKTLKEDIQQLNRCIVDKNAKISTLELFSKTNSDELKKKNHELEHVFKRARDENHMLRRELRHLKEITNVRKVEQCTQTVDEQSIVSSAMMAGHKSMTEKIIKLENDNQMMKKMLHHRKLKIEGLQRQLDEKH